MILFYKDSKGYMKHCLFISEEKGSQLIRDFSKVQMIIRSKTDIIIFFVLSSSINKPYHQEWYKTKITENSAVSIGSKISLSEGKC